MREDLIPIQFRTAIFILLYGINRTPRTIKLVKNIEKACYIVLRVLSLYHKASKCHRVLSQCNTRLRLLYLSNKRGGSIHILGLLRHLLWVSLRILVWEEMNLEV